MIIVFGFAVFLFALGVLIVTCPLLVSVVMSTLNLVVLLKGEGTIVRILREDCRMMMILRVLGVLTMRTLLF